MNLKSLFQIILFLYSVFAQSQITNFKEKFELPSEVKETSGLILLDGKIITHNDSGDGANLYEIDSISGSLIRTVSLSNASNIDWEDIAEDSNHIYIADIGNNNGNRQDLKIYKILKSDYKNENSVLAEIITFSYEDQTDFSNQPNSSNFDAEAIVVYQNSILIFSKNWADLKTNVYKISTSAGNHIATKVSSANVEGLITGASLVNDNFLLCGYDATLSPFLIYIGGNRVSGDNIFSSGFEKNSLLSEMGQGSQVEGITSFGSVPNSGKYYISREKFSITIGETLIDFTQKIYEFSDNRSVLSVSKNEINNLIVSPNPIRNKITINSSQPISKVEIFNFLGKSILKKQLTNKEEINTSSLSKGIYYLKIESKNKKITFKKIIKI